MATMRLVALITVLLCAQVFLSDARRHRKHGHDSHLRRIRRQARSSQAFNQFAAAVGLDPSSMSASCRSQFVAENGGCLSAVQSCFSSGSRCEEIEDKCQSRCPQRSNCTMSVKLGGLFASSFESKTTPITFCFPLACRGKTYQKSLTVFTKAILDKVMMALKASNFFSSGAISLDTMTSRCDTGMVICRTPSSSCSFQQVRRPKHTYPTYPRPFRPVTFQAWTQRPTHRPLPGKKPWTQRPTWRPWNQRPTHRPQPGKKPWTQRPTWRPWHQRPTHKPHVFQTWTHHPTRSSWTQRPTRRIPQGWLRGRTSKPQHPTRWPKPNRADGKNPWNQHPTTSVYGQKGPRTDWKLPKTDFPKAGGRCQNCEAVEGMTCCRIGGTEAGCCPTFVSDFVYSMLDVPLSQLSPVCRESLVVEKSQCFDEYVDCLDEVYNELSKLESETDETGAFPSPEKLSLLAAMPNMKTCTRIQQCLLTTSGGRKCPYMNSCKATTHSTSLFGLGGHAEKYNVCLPLDCQKQGDVKQLASLLFDSTCGPFCIAEGIFKSFQINTALPTCPIQDLTLTCTDHVAWKPVSSTQREKGTSDVCQAALDIAKQFNKGSQDEGTDIMEYYRSHHSDNNKDEKHISWNNPWLVVGIVSAGLTFLVAVILLVRWNIVSRRRRAQANVYTYGHLNDETSTPDVANH